MFPSRRDVKIYVVGKRGWEFQTRRTELINELNVRRTAVSDQNRGSDPRRVIRRSAQGGVIPGRTPPWGSKRTRRHLSISDEYCGPAPGMVGKVVVMEQDDTRPGWRRRTGRIADRPARSCSRSRLQKLSRHDAKVAATARERSATAQAAAGTVVVDEDIP